MKGRCWRRKIATEQRDDSRPLTVLDGALRGWPNSRLHPTARAPLLSRVVIAIGEGPRVSRALCARGVAMMSYYELKHRLPSCHVTPTLLQAIEDYVLAQAPQSLGASPEKVRSGYRIEVEEGLGTESLSSIAEMGRLKFSDSTASIRIVVSQLETSGRVDVYFHRDDGVSRVAIRAEGDNARATAVGLYDGIMRVIEPHRTSSWLFHPHPVLVGMLSAGAPIAFLVAVGVALRAKPGPGSAAAFAALLGVAGYHAMSFLRPYTSFESRQSERRDRLWSWFATGLAAFILFGTTFTWIRQRLLGF